MTEDTATFDHCAVHLATAVETPKGKGNYGHTIDHDIVAISYIYLKGSTKKLNVSCGNLVINPQKEKDVETILTEFAARYEGAEVKKMITFWGDGFTLPVLYFNCLKLGVSIPSIFGPSGIYPRHKEGNIELMHLLTNYKALDASRVKMEDYFAKLTPFPNRTRSDVAAMLNVKNYGGIRTGLALDVLSMVMFYLRHLVVTGTLDLEEEQRLLRKVFTVSGKKNKKVGAFLKPHLSSILR